MFIHKNSPARLGCESAPRGGQGSCARAADPGGPGGPGGSAACSELPAGSGAEPDSELKFQGAGRIGVSALGGMVFVCVCVGGVIRGPGQGRGEYIENARRALGHALGTWDFLLWSEGRWDPGRTGFGLPSTDHPQLGLPTRHLPLLQGLGGLPTTPPGSPFPLQIPCAGWRAGPKLREKKYRSENCPAEGAFPELPLSADREAGADSAGSRGRAPPLLPWPVTGEEEKGERKEERKEVGEGRGAGGAEERQRNEIWKLGPEGKEGARVVASVSPLI